MRRFLFSPGKLRVAVVAIVTVAACIVAVAAAADAATEGNEPLPELGDSAERVLTPAQEKRIGRQFMRQLMRDSAYLADPELNAYLNQLGAQVAAQASLRGTPITVHLLENPVLNAFAVPGGHITFHTGLLLTAADEGELASVMGHEIAHISQRHLPRLLAKSEAGKLPAAAAILASILVGGQVGLAGFTAANAALISNQLAYTRDFEREADAIGIKLLAESGFDPSAMSRFFDKLDRNRGLGDSVPEFLRTHPLSYTRIAEAENRAGLYPAKNYPSSRTFRFARAKVRAWYATREQGDLAYFQDQVKKTLGDERDAVTYGLALAYYKLRRFDEARVTLQPVLDAHPDEVALHIARAEIDAAGGRPKAAAARYAELVAAHPDLVYLTHYQAEALLAAGDAAAAKRIVRHQLRRHKELFTLYPLLAKSNGKLGLLAEAHQATAEFHAALGEYPAAAVAVKQALRESDSDADGYLHQSLTARLKELEEAVAKHLP